MKEGEKLWVGPVTPRWQGSFVLPCYSWIVQHIGLAATATAFSPPNMTSHSAKIYLLSGLCYDVAMVNREDWRPEGWQEVVERAGGHGAGRRLWGRRTNARQR